MKAAGLVLNPNKLIKLRKNEPEAMDIEEALNYDGAPKPEKKVIFHEQINSIFRSTFRFAPKKPRAMPKRLKRRLKPKQPSKQSVHHHVCPQPICNFVS